ncbi:flagellar hook protein FlgE [Oceanidesulfovibrio marinus]|uniref:Flagellar hook protein FlgE n=1 Tax=Oceanidesulfovibrio marinus TaxID=370038 RepID=A0A6P1ZQF5_9BACT|nr:flagellar hook-basal body complex protein [Oceanidesulfovibrio marinus]QJT08847.1 flagellar hook protein FlgE [Oceanidesulfovibrio marinus]TVM36727.1 flagellar biosynthesis protein FlgE [Oceanidesulfovibrio marinus]
MSLSASMWTGVSGLLAHGERMNVLGNNIANTNTVGFKASRMHFADFISQDVGTTGDYQAQVGRGVSVHAIYGDFSQGAFETTNEATDLAIGGKGFFGVSPKGSEDRYYTRAGNFRFDKDGYLIDPNGFVVQGWQLESQPTTPAQEVTRSSDQIGLEQVNRIGSIGDIRIGAGGVAQPQHTNNITMITQLDKDNGGDNSQSVSDANPFFALAGAWDGTQDEPLSPQQYAYQSTLKVYDEGGTAHDITIYYDQVSTSNVGDTNVWEYIVTMDPDEDKRFLGGNAVEGEAKGLLMMGTLTFNSANQMTDMSAYTIVSNADFSAGSNSTLDLNEWYPTQISNNGYPIFSANFTGLSNASAVLDSSGDFIKPPMENAQGKLIELNLGLRTTPNGDWDYGSDGRTSAAGIGNTPDVLDRMPGFGTDATRNASATTSYDASSATLFQSQDGYTFGFLQSINVTQDGILQGRYSNGVTLELFQVALFDFASQVGMRREGNNLFSETRESPLTSSQPPNTAGLGTISSNSLEQSNVDLAREFVDMIATQRGFSANGKVITTTDQMLSEVIMLKR